LTSNRENWKLEIIQKDELSVKKKRYKKLKIKNNAPNCVQKNIK
jgi:hypothetical protein